MRVFTRLIFALASASIAGCITVGPDYKRPTADVPDTWRIEVTEAHDVANTRWWEQFGDPVLTGLIETALKENLDVRIAATRVDQFIGIMVTTRAQGLPQIGYSAGASNNRASEVGFPPLSPVLDPQFSLYQAALGASWQLDLFGRVRRLTEGARAQVYASQQAQRGVVLSLVASVVTSYVSLRGLDKQREIAVATAANFGETVRIFTARYKFGMVSETDLNEARAQYKLAQVAIPAIDQQIAALENGLAVLLGRNPGPIPRGKTIDQLILPTVPADLPSTLLERRPDILQAEQNLVTANANVGAARALYYPDISLTGLLGSTSTAIADFLSGPAMVQSIAGSIAGPIFTSGAISGQVESTEAQRQQAELFYQQTIIRAFSDTNSALTGLRDLDEQVLLQQQRVSALRTFALLSWHKYEAGLIGYLEVQISEVDLFSADLALASLRSQRYAQAVSVYQAMGGGWVDKADALTPAPVHPIESRIRF